MAEISMQVDVTFHNAPRMRGYWGTLGVEVSPKRMQLLHELLPTGTIAVLVNPSRPTADALEVRMRNAAAAVSGSPAPWAQRLDFLAIRPLQAARLVAASDAQFQGMSSSRREAGHRFTSLVSTSSK